MLTRLLIEKGTPWWICAGAILGDFLIFGLVLFAILNVTPRRARKSIVAAVTFLVGLAFALEYFVPAGRDGRNLMTGPTDKITEVMIVVLAFTLGLGIFSLIGLHGRALIRRKPGWINSLAFFLAFIALMVAGFLNTYRHTAASGRIFDMLFQSTVVAPGATMFSIVGFYIVSAAYRAFRIRSSEATLMLVAAFIVMLGQVPIGMAMTNWLPHGNWLSVFRLENMSEWILNNPNAAAQRGMIFGIEVGALAMSLRLWLSLERGSFFDQEL